MPPKVESQVQPPAKRPPLKLSIPGHETQVPAASSHWDPRKASELERHRLQGNAFYRQETEKLKSNAFYQQQRSSPDPMSGTILHAPATSMIGSDPRQSDILMLPRQPSPAVTTWSFFGTDTPDLPSNKSRRNLLRRLEPLHLVPGNTVDAQPTLRQQIEGRNESKLHQMMGMNVSEPSTPRVAFEEPTEESYNPVVTVRDLTRSGSKKGQAPKSPQKKVLGISIPFTRAKSPTKGMVIEDGEDIPPLPFLPGVGPKAHQVLGTAKRVPVPILKRPQRSHTVTSLPKELFEKHDSDEDVIPPVKFASMNSNARYKAATPASQAASEPIRPSSSPPGKNAIPRPSFEKSLSFPSPSRPPPTPPKKDTPPHLKRENALGGTGLGITTEQCEAAHDGDGIVSPVAEREANLAKFVDCGSQAVGSLVQKVPSIYSMRAAVVDAQSRSAGFDPAAGFQTPQQHVGRWSDGVKDYQRRLDGLLPGGLLPPTRYYSPSIYSQPFESPRLQPVQKYTDRLAEIKEEHSRNVSTASRTSQISDASIPVVFQGREEEITPDGAKTTFEAPEKSQSKIVDPSKKDIISLVKASLGLNEEQPIAQSVTQPATQTSTNEMRSQLKIDEPQRLAHWPAEASEEHNNVPAEKPAQRPSQPNEPTKPYLPSDLTPLLEQELNNTDSPTRRSHPQFSPEAASAMPTPLYGHHEFSLPPISAMAPPPLLADPGLLTHFDVVHHHLGDIANSLHHATDTNHEKAVEMIGNKHDETFKVLNEHFAGVRASLNAVEHNVGRASGETEAVRAAVEKLATTVQDKLVGRVEGLLEANKGLCDKIDGLEARVAAFEKKLDSWEKPQDQPGHPSYLPHAQQQQMSTQYDVQPQPLHQHQHYGYPMRQPYAQNSGHGQREYMVPHGMVEEGQHQQQLPERMGQGQPYGNPYYRSPYGAFQQAK
ncbi:hypothetical protein H2199_006512 [Coniosporium tulheliwenetii]|uniref:Uncharacterized protein n=1 Tax=Coniosporium tulheliwenetii TaxID=3383036 RepID=A0ACC2YVW9_9PEZI|nr:hypothetical protein H2199_006512 [Cladosporium sp. JES 115]